MNENHRKLILNNLDKLADTTEYSTMIFQCQKKEIITDTMAKNIQGDGKDDNERNLLLFEKITHRGPKAFDRLLDILKDQNFNEAHLMLTQSASIASATFKNDEVAMEDEKFVSICSTRNLNFERQISNNNNNGNIIDEADKMMVKNDGLFPSKEVKLKLEPYNQLTSFQFNPAPEVKRAERVGTHPKLGVYSMKSAKRGVFFFVNIINFPQKKTRSGADCDRENLITLFREMGYKIFYYEDLRREQFIELIRELTKSDHLKGIDSFVMCVQTHGTIDFNKTLMEFSDGATWGVEEVIELFSNRQCEALTNKPKVFFFPFCRGPSSDREHQPKRYQRKIIETDGAPSAGVPSYSDILICYGTVPGFATHRDVQFGSWYARELCKVFAEHAFDTHLEDLMKLVSSKTSEMRDEGRLQVASTENRGFNKLLFFNPRI